MASLHPRTTANGVAWRIHYRIDGKQKVATFESEKVANYWLARFDVSPAGAEAALAQAIEVPETDLTVEEAVRFHIESLSGIRPRTRADYLKDAERNIFPLIGEHPISAVTKPIVSGWINELERQGLAAKTIANRHGLLSAAFNTQVEAGALKMNPCRRPGLPRDNPEDEMQCMSHSDFAVLLAEIPERWQPLVKFLAGSGLRWGEATALKVADFTLDTPRPTVRVTNAVGRDDNNRLFVGLTKTRKSRRTVRLAPEVAKDVVKLSEGRPRDAFVFTTRTGRMVTHNNFHERVWKPAMLRLQKAGWVDPPRIHDLRHTFASWALGAGVPITDVQRALGHESIVTTVNVYGHLQQGAGDAVAQAISVALSPSTPMIES